MKIPRILIAGTSSGSGKTTAVCAVLALLKRRGIPVRAAKCGPDYIDPMFHREVSGVPCTNLDPFFADGDLLRYLLGRNAGEGLTVIEGVMGYYDGTGEKGTDNSTFTVAERTETPVLLTVDAKGSAASLLAVIEGFLRFVPESRVRGVLFNRMSKMNYQNVKRLMKDRFGDAVLPAGYLPALPEECLFGSRHLGLVTAGEIEDLAERIRKTADLAEGTMELDTILSLAEGAPELEVRMPDIRRRSPVKIAVARDRAFSFLYEDTLSLLRDMGAEIAFFSPLGDEEVPEGSDGLWLPGGYPELYAETLEKNLRSKESVSGAIRSGMPAIAECGGFQYLGKELSGHRMCGVLPHTSENTGKLVRFGYVTLTSRKAGLFGPAGTELRAHEFHYYDSSETGDAFLARKPNGREWECAVLEDTLYAGYPHLYLPADLPAAEAFYRKCLEYKENRG